VIGQRTEWDLAVIRRQRRALLDFIDLRTHNLKHDMEELARRVGNLLSDTNPPLTEDELKYVSDAKLALADSSGAMLAIRLAEEQYKRELANAMLQAAE